jgi:hypothetical protein
LGIRFELLTQRPNFARPEEFEPLIPQAVNMTGISHGDLKIVFGLTYYSASSISFLLSSIFASLFIIMGINNYKKLNYFTKKYFGLSIRFTNLFISTIGVFIGQILTTIGILYVPYPYNFYLILSGRIIFGFSDGFQESISS